MKNLFGLAVFLSVSLLARSQCILDLDSCRALAIANNKGLLMSKEKMNAAHYQRKAAFTSYLPSVSALGTYMRNEKDISLLSEEQRRALPLLGTGAKGQMQGLAEVIGSQYPNLAPLLPLLGETLETSLNNIGSALEEGLRTDTKNMYAGAVTVTQPLYMGGKIRAYHKITKYAEELARQQHNGALQEIILNTDEAYWQTVSLVHKRRLAKSYLGLLQRLESDVEKMIAEGVATKADGLTVKVRVNEAEMGLLRVEDGLCLTRMLLCQLCGLDLSSEVSLRDEYTNDIETVSTGNQFVIETVYANRPEIKSLELASRIYEQKVFVERAGYLPSVALTGNYIVSNPSSFNGFENKFRGMWNVGVMVQMPIWHWGQGMYKVKAAKAEARMAQYQLDNVKEKIGLEVNQSIFKVNEAAKRLSMAEKNLERANENLRYATLGFEEGVIPTSNVLEAQTAWLSAQSERIDAQIDVRLTDVYFRKASGESIKW